MKAVKVLFILKRREDYSSPSWGNVAMTGLGNSACYVSDMLIEQGIDSSVVIAQDDNSIDALVTQNQPTHVIIEALWVRPAKFAQLVPLHPAVKWAVRLHSELPFISMEGMMMSWLAQYVLIPHINIMVNSRRTQSDLSVLGSPIIYGPNYYPLFPIAPRRGIPADTTIDIGCFGAIRILKNQLAQAVAAIDFGAAVNLPIRFHINSDRVEGQAYNVLKNLRGLFTTKGATGDTLVEHPWLGPADFQALCRTMDIGMQVSFSETFNIVSADLTQAGVAVVGSSEIPWLAKTYQADPTSVPDMVAKLKVAYHGGWSIARQNYEGLEAYDAASMADWPVALLSMV